MNCPKCGQPTKVIDSRPHATGVRRRRKCLGCGHRATTVEVWEGSRVFEALRPPVVRAVDAAIAELEKVQRLLEKNDDSRG